MPDWNVNAIEFVEIFDEVKVDVYCKTPILLLHTINFIEEKRREGFVTWVSKPFEKPASKSYTGKLVGVRVHASRPGLARTLAYQLKNLQYNAGEGERHDVR